MYYTSKNILKTSILHYIKFIFMIIIEFIIVYVVANLIGEFKISNYFDWIIYAIIITLISIITIVLINLIFNKGVLKLRRK